MAKKIEKLVTLSSGYNTVVCQCSECKAWVHRDNAKCDKCGAVFDK